MSSPVNLFASALLTGSIFTVGGISIFGGAVAANYITEELGKKLAFPADEKIKRIASISIAGAGSALALGAVLSFGTGVVVALPFFPKLTTFLAVVIAGVGAKIGYDNAKKFVPRTVSV